MVKASGKVYSKNSRAISWKWIPDAFRGSYVSVAHNQNNLLGNGADSLTSYL